MEAEHTKEPKEKDSETVHELVRLPSEPGFTRSVYLLRHGWAVSNEKRLINGTPEHSLTEKGRRQVRAARKLIKLYDLSFTHCFVSHWKRARETAALFLPDQNFVVDRRLGETEPGKAALMNFTEFVARYPNFFPIDPDQPFPGGETHRQHFTRAVDWFREVTSTTEEGSQILAVCHTGTISCLLQHVCKMGMAGFPVFVPQHASLTKLVQVSNELWKIAYFSVAIPEKTASKNGAI